LGQGLTHSLQPLERPNDAALPGSLAEERALPLREVLAFDEAVLLVLHFLEVRLLRKVYVFHFHQHEQLLLLAEFA